MWSSGSELSEPVLHGHEFRHQNAWVDSVDGPVKTCETNMKTLIETHLSKWLVYHGYITIYLQHICLDGNQVTRC